MGSTRGGGGPTGDRTVAYVLMGFPRLSETFIASELYRLERAGVPLRLYVIKPVEEREQGVRHTVADALAVRPEYLPGLASRRSALPAWLAANARPFLPGLGRVARRHPIGLARATAAAAAQAVRVHRRPRERRSRLLPELMQAVALADRLSGAPDVRHLHAHFAHGTTTVTWLASTITGLGFSFTGHAKDIYTESLNPAGLLRRKLRAARFAVTCTDAGRRHLERVADGGATVHCIYHGLNVEFAQLLARPAAHPAAANGELRVLGVGRLVAKKGFDVFVEACGILAGEGVPLKATIVGQDDEQGPTLRRLIAARGLEGRVRLAGPMGQAELYGEYRRAGAFCLPCRVLDSGDRDGLPNVLVEAMACGLPSVTTGISGIPELVDDGVNGLLVAPEDPEALAGALLRVHRDRELAARLGREAQATVKGRLDADRQAERLASLFEEACS